MYYFGMKDFFPNEMFFVEQTTAIVNLRLNVVQKKTKTESLFFFFL